MNYEEEQLDELEALKEIYYNEIKVISNKPPIAFSIKVRPQNSNTEVLTESDDDDSEGNSDEEDFEEEVDEDEDILQQQGPSIDLRFDLPPRYPHEKPSMQITSFKEVSEDEISIVMKLLDRKCEESLGEVMIFMLVSEVMEWLTTKSEQTDELRNEKEFRERENAAEEQRKFGGTIVTEQTFMVWKAKFDAEMLKAKLERQKQQQQSEQGSNARRLTGREMFESDKTLAESDLNFVEDLDQSQLEALLQDIDDIDLGDNNSASDEEDLGVDSDDDDDFEVEEFTDDEDADRGCTSKERGGGGGGGKQLKGKK